MLRTVEADRFKAAQMSSMGTPAAASALSCCNSSVDHEEAAAGTNVLRRSISADPGACQVRELWHGLAKNAKLVSLSAASASACDFTRTATRALGHLSLGEMPPITADTLWSAVTTKVESLARCLQSNTAVAHGSREWSSSPLRP